MVEASDYDSPWKEAIESYFEPFMAFFFPQIHAEIHWVSGYEFLDKELEKVVREAEIGRRYADKLVKVFLHDGKETWILVHIEVQGYYEAAFEQRMYIYNYRIFDRYNTEVVSLAVLCDPDSAYRPDRYSRSRWGCELSFRFPVVKLVDFDRDWGLLESNPNPFAVVVMAQLKAQQIRDGQERKRWKMHLVRTLYERGYKRQDVLELFRFIDWLMVLPEEVDTIFWKELRKLEEDNKMPYVTSVERIGMKKGFEKGVKQGALQNAREMVLEVVSARFGIVTEDVAQMVQEIHTPATLKSLLQLAVKSENFDDFKHVLQQARAK